jgi:predicted GH43/DUF377 family glycosyl hydrolase
LKDWFANMKWIFILQLLICCQEVFAWIDLEALLQDQKIITSIRILQFPAFPGAHNPSIVKNQQGFLLIFRYIPESHKPWMSHIGIVQLDDDLNPLSIPALLNTREEGSKTPSQAEDARFFSYRNRLFLIYNDNLETVDPQKWWHRRDMFIAEVLCFDGHYELSVPLKLIYPEEYNMQLWQKNWTPFVYENKLYFSYSLNPHLILFPNMMTGECYAQHKTQFHSNWIFGPLRGSSEAILVDGEYLSFFHSGIYEASSISWPWIAWHYFMGAYTFSAKPPFGVTSITDKPILARNLYTSSDRQKRVIFPGGFAVVGSSIYVAYGKDDCELGVMTLDKEELKKALKPVSH